MGVVVRTHVTIKVVRFCGLRRLTTNALILQRYVFPHAHRGSSVSLIPNLWSRFRVRLVWLLRAVALRRCVLCNSAAVRSSSFFEGRSFSHQQGINAAIAVCTWHSVSSGFFPPEFLTHPRQEQIADRAEDQMAFQPLITSALVMVQAHLPLLVLKTTLHAPAREGHQ